MRSVCVCGTGNQIIWVAVSRAIVGLPFEPLGWGYLLSSFGGVGSCDEDRIKHQIEGPLIRDVARNLGAGGRRTTTNPTIVEPFLGKRGCGGVGSGYGQCFAKLFLSELVDPFRALPPLACRPLMQGVVLFGPKTPSGPCSSITDLSACHNSRAGQAPCRG